MKYDRFLVSNLFYIKYLINIYLCEYFLYMRCFFLKFINFLDFGMFIWGFYGIFVSYIYGLN